MPSASATSAIVDAVPMVLQCPRLRIMADSERVNCSAERVPARTSSDNRQTSVPQPRETPRKVPVSIGPPGTTTAGRSTEAAAMSKDGMVLSQPPSSTTPSIGLARSISSVAIAAMLRHSIAVGRSRVSPSDTTGNSSGMPPGLVHTVLHRRSHLGQMGVARGEVRGRIRDCDMRTAGERVAGHPATHPRPVDIGVAIIAGVPLGTPQPASCSEVVG